MPEVVQVSSIEQREALKTKIEELFKKAKYEEITQAIGMHSILIDPTRMMSDQAGLYRFVLNLIKDRVGKSKGKLYEAWFAEFPGLLDELIASRQVVTDKASVDVLSSYRDAQGRFLSVDEFFFWALNDRRLTLEQTVKYIERTAEMQRTAS
ncbi:MAG TPA: hypothetical protein VF903_05125 [Nitrospirota bacterium]